MIFQKSQGGKNDKNKTESLAKARDSECRIVVTDVKGEGLVSDHPLLNGEHPVKDMVLFPERSISFNLLRSHNTHFYQELLGLLSRHF